MGFIINTAAAWCCWSRPSARLDRRTAEEPAHDITPTELVCFLDALYTGLDGLVDRHALEKTKTSGDSYMVISGVPQSRTDHLQDPQGREVPLRIGLAAGLVVTGVVGARKFFHDVWGDVVNVASRMEARTSSKNAAR
jgi:adenylate cyclase